MPKLSCFNNLATVVQFGLGHQIANLVTRVQIPAVANNFFLRFVIIFYLLFPSSDCTHSLHYLSLEAELPSGFPEKCFHCSIAQLQANQFLLKLRRIEAF